MRAETAPGQRRLRRLRLALLAAAAASLVLGAATLLLLRDPTPRMVEGRQGLATVVEGAAERSAGLLSRTVQLRDSAGLSVQLVVRTPVGVADRDPAPSLGPDAAGRRALFLVLGGYRTGEQAAMLVDDTRGAVVAAVGYPYDGPVDVSGFAVLRHVPRIRRALVDTPPAVQLALDYLLSRPDVDPSRVELVGVSLGAFLAPVTAALDPRVTRLWLLHGSGRPYRVLERGLEPSIPYGAPRALVAAAANVAFFGPPLAPERWVPLVAPRPVIMVNSRDDERLPPEAVAALYESARAPKEQIWVAGPHVHPDRRDLIDDLVDVMLSRAAEGDGPTLE